MIRKGRENTPWKGTPHTLQRLREGIKRRKMSREPCRDPQINFRNPVDCSGGVLPFMLVPYFPEQHFLCTTSVKFPISRTEFSNASAA